MIITSIQELRLASPAHALDSIDALVGYIDNSEHDFLEDKLGTPLYEALCRWYDQNPATRSTVADYQTGYWNRLLLIAQRCVAFDALGRDVGTRAISVNNAGINQMVADDYPAPDKNGKTIDLYRETCVREAHAALNQMLRQLELWCKAEGEEADTEPAADPDAGERTEIITLWKQSRYYYLSTELLIPTCTVLQEYVNVYENREKFIQLLPDLQFIQEEVIQPAIGDSLTAALVAYSADGTLPAGADKALFDDVLHKLRKVMAAQLVQRTSVLKFDKDMRLRAHDDGVRLFQNACDYIRQRQQGFPEALIAGSPLYVQPVAPPPADAQKPERPATPAGAPLRQPACWTEPLL